jgi:glycosyltransferase involved in cell wall biosynthesis
VKRGEQLTCSSSNVSVSIIIPCYNSAWALPTLVNCLIPLLSDDVEVIFIDDGSTDNSFELFSRLLPSATRLRQENCGVGATRNKAVEIARGEFVQLLDADDTINPGKLEAQVTYARAHGLDVVYSDWRMVIVENGCELREPVVHAETQMEIVEALLGGWWFPPCAALIRKQAFFSIGGCDATLINTCDDFDLWVRLGIADFKYGYLAGHFANYYRYKQVRSTSRKNPREFAEGEERIILKALELLEDQRTLTLPRRRAAARRLHAVARNVYTIDEQWFIRLFEQIYRLDPDFKPQGPHIYRIAAHLLGLIRAEKLAAWKRDRSIF